MVYLCHCMKAIDCCGVILREERTKDLKIFHYVRSFAIAQDDRNCFVYRGGVQPVIIASGAKQSGH